MIAIGQNFCKKENSWLLDTVKMGTQIWQNPPQDFDFTKFLWPSQDV